MFHFILVVASCLGPLGKMETPSRTCKQERLLLTVGNWSVKFGNIKEENTVGPYGLGSRSKAGGSFVVQASLVISWLPAQFPNSPMASAAACLGLFRWIPWKSD